ncbi:unnamed protein product, partial [Hydatigera taeniaeformis]|uniref:Ig-like domain-containing protein n=1 Tax=Hydatigena taeniaeformis TaxID=6205 RepID=A0A0R3WJB5_HYDTA
MLQPSDVEHCLASLSQTIPTLQWWRFELSKPFLQKHIWISLPADVEVVCGKSSLLPKNTQLLGRLNILHWGADCLIQGIRITPSEEDQIVCIETRASEYDSMIFWIDVNQLVIMVAPNGIQEIADNSRPTQPILGSHIWGWLSGLEVSRSHPQAVTKRCFLIPVDFSNRDDIAVLLSHHVKSERTTMCEPSLPSGKLIVVNPQTNELYSCHLDSTPTCQTYSTLKGARSEMGKKEVVSGSEEGEEVDEELTFPASMMDEEATKRDTKLSETLVEIEDFLGRVIWTIQNPSDRCVDRDANVEAQRCRIAMQLAEMQSCEEDLRTHESNASLSLLEKLLEILTSLLEIGEMVNLHRRRDELCILRLVDQKLPEITAWVNRSQVEEGNAPPPQPRHILNQLVCIQSAIQTFVSKAKPTVNLEALISKVDLCVRESLESEIRSKLEKAESCHEVSLRAEGVLTAFAESMKAYLTFHSTAVTTQLKKSSFPLQTLQHIKSNLMENMAVLKSSCAWIPCILSEEIQQRLNISQDLITDLKAIHNRAFEIYKQMEMHTSLVCEHSGLFTLAVRLTNILERATDDKLSQCQISQLDQELDRCEAECVMELLSNDKENHTFVSLVVRSLLEHISAARKVVNGVQALQEPQCSEKLERLEYLTSAANLPSSSAFFEALLIGWYLQTMSSSGSQVDELVCQLEQKVSTSLQDTALLHLRVSEMEEFLSQLSINCIPCNVEASSLRGALLVLSEVILRLKSAAQLLERMTFLTNFHPSQRLETLRLAYSRALEGLTKCFQALEVLLRELSEWRKGIILVEDSDQHDTATQGVIEAVSFATDVISQELKNVHSANFSNAPDILSQLLIWLTNFHSSLIGFRKTCCQYRLEKSAIYSQSCMLLHDLLNLEWLLDESRLQSQRDLVHEIGGTATCNMEKSWMVSIQKILEEIEPSKRRRLLNLLEGMERSSREQKKTLLGLLMGSRERVEILEGVTRLNYIVTRAESFTDLKSSVLEEKYLKMAVNQSDVNAKHNSNFHEGVFYTLMKNLAEQISQLRDKQNGICDGVKAAECLHISEILVKIGHHYMATSKCSRLFIDRVLFSYWPEVLLKLVASDQSRRDKLSLADWRTCALDFRKTVARCLAKESFGFAEEGLPKVETKDIDGSLAKLQVAIEETNRLFHGIQDDFSTDNKDVWQACLHLHDLFLVYVSQLGHQLNDLTLPSLRTIRKDLRHLDSRIIQLAQGRPSPGALDDCSQSVTHLEESLQALRQTARILFTCLVADSRPSPKVTPSKHLDVNELYKRAVKLVSDYEASEIGCQILESWQQLQSIADKLGRLQAGLPLNEPLINYETTTTHSPMVSTGDIHLDGFSSASMARKRSWSLLEILGSHECLYPGCRGKKSNKHENHFKDNGLLHDLHTFYSLLCSDFHDRTMQIPVGVLTSNTQEAISSEIALVNLRQEWHRDMSIVNQFNSLQRRVKLDDSGSKDIKSSFELIKAIWGETVASKVFFEATERLATVSSWLCEVERHLELNVLPKLQTAWKNSADTDTLSVVERCVYKMNEIAEDLEGLQNSGILSERHLKTVKHSLQAGWFSVREFLLERCVKSTFHEDPTSTRFFPLVDDFLRHSAELGFPDSDLKAIHTNLCNQYLLHGLTQHECHPVEGGRKFCSTSRSLRLMFLPSWLTERYRIVQRRPPIALTIHSIPDISTEAYPPFSSATELAFHSPKCAELQSRRWFSLPNIRSMSLVRLDFKEQCSSKAEDSQEMPNNVEMKTSQLSFTAILSEDEISETDGGKEELTTSKDSEDSALMRDVRLLLTQLKAQRSATTNSSEEDSNEMDFGPIQSQDVKEGERSTTLTPPECP